MKNKVLSTDFLLFLALNDYENMLTGFFFDHFYACTLLISNYHTMIYYIATLFGNTDVMLYELYVLYIKMRLFEKIQHLTKIMRDRNRPYRGTR